MKTLGIKNFDHHKFHDARSHAKSYGPGQDPFETTQRKCVRLSKEQVVRALRFLDDPRFLQDVAYGTKKLDVGEGKMVEIPAVLRKRLPEKLWQDYQVHKCTLTVTPTLTLSPTPTRCRSNTVS